MGFDEVARDREPEPAASRLAALDEAIEDPRQQFGIDAGTVVGSVDREVICLQRHAHFDQSALGRVAERVLRQVVYDLAEAHWIDLDCRSVEDGRREGETYTTGLGVCAEG